MKEFLIFVTMISGFMPWYIKYMNQKYDHATDVRITFYFPRPEETDDSPCVGAIGIDQCEGAKSGNKYVALSRDLLPRYPYKSFVRLESKDPACSGVFQVVDTTNARLSRIADIFDPTHTTNKSCKGVIYPYHK